MYIHNSNYNQEAMRWLIKYVKLTKPKIVILLAITGIVAYLLPVTVVKPTFIQIVIFVFCGYCSAGGAMAINNVIDADIDKKMKRTENRASVSEFSHNSVLTFGIVLMLIGFLVSYFYFGLFTMLFLAYGALFYIFVYTLVVKRTTVFNTILGGLASPAPVWAAYAARYEIAGISDAGFLNVPLEGWLLGLLVYLWTPTHTWAMAVKNYDDYKAAEIPMLPVQIGIKNTSRLNLVGIILIVGYALWLVNIFNPNLVYIAILLSLIFIYDGIKFVKIPTIESGRRNFFAHNFWLAFIFLLFI